MLLITVIFIWIALVICIFLFLQSSLVWYILKRKYSDEIYNEQTISNSTIQISDNEDDDNDNQIEFEREEQYYNMSDFCTTAI